MNGELHQIEVTARNNKNEMRREVGKSCVKGLETISGFAKRRMDFQSVFLGWTGSPS